jgi:hypothetical protein
VAKRLDPDQFQLRCLPTEIEGNAAQTFTLFEVCDADEPALAAEKRAMAEAFAEAVALANDRNDRAAALAFTAIATASPRDVPVQRLRDRYRARILASDHVLTR